MTSPSVTDNGRETAQKGAGPLSTTSTLSDPILGPKAKLALRTPAGGRKRQKLLVLLAAYADAGVTDPPVRALMTRTGIPTVVGADALLRSLEQAGLIRVDWARGRPQRNRYELPFTDGDDPGDAS